MYVDVYFEFVVGLEKQPQAAILPIHPPASSHTLSYPICPTQTFTPRDTARLSSSTGWRASSQTPCKQPSQRNRFLDPSFVAATQKARRDTSVVTQGTET